MVSRPLDIGSLKACPVDKNRVHSPNAPCAACERSQSAGAVIERARATASKPAAITASAPTKPKPGQASEDALCASLSAAGLGGYVTQHEFAKPLGRKYRADVAYVSARLLVEVDGQVHSIKDKRERDCARDSIAAILGWRVVRATPKQVRDGLAVEWVRLALGKASELPAGEG